MAIISKKRPTGSIHFMVHPQSMGMESKSLARERVPLFPVRYDEEEVEEP